MPMLNYFHIHSTYLSAELKAYIKINSSLHTFIIIIQFAMAPIFSLIRELNNSKTLCAIKLRHVRFYEKPSFNDNKQISSLECVFHDAAGDRIRGTVRKYQIQNFKRSLKEGHVYAIKDFVVEKETDKYKTSATKVKILFYGKTHVFEMFDETFPRFMYNFTKFTDLYDKDKVDDTMLIDIIGKVISMHSAQNKDINGRFTRFLDLTLEDLENNRLTCTLWENYAEQILPHLEQQLFEPVVIILQMGRAKFFKDQVKVSNSFHVTKLLVNEKVQEIKDFKKRIMSSNNPTYSISHVSFPSARTAREELEAPDASVKTVDYLYNSQKSGSFWICARVVSISDEWWYLACTNCTKKMHPAADNFFCGKCDSLFETGILRYMAHVQVVDESASATLLCWDRDLKKLIGKSCSDLRKEHLERGGEELPPKLSCFINKKLLFKVHVKSEQQHNYSGIFSVSKMSADPDLIWKYGVINLESQKSDFLSRLQSDDVGDDKEESSSESEVNTPIKNLKKRSSTSESPLCKRRLNEDFSSSTTSMKLKSVIKIEDEKRDVE